MSDEVSDESLVELLESGHDEIRADPELTEQARQHITLQMDDLVQRILSELRREP